VQLIERENHLDLRLLGESQERAICGLRRQIEVHGRGSRESGNQSDDA